MNLPVVLDIALGLVFTYLILSLLASEIQELIATVLQWRAVHLKKSIEIFLAGDVKNSDTKDVLDLVNRIYNNPIIRSINQETKGFLSTLPRKMTWKVADIVRSVKNLVSRSSPENKIFANQNSGPSYISSDSFVSGLLEELKVPKIIHALAEVRLENFKIQHLREIKLILTRSLRQIAASELSTNVTHDINDDFVNLDSEYRQIVDDFKNQRFDVDTSVNRMQDSLSKYINNFQANIENNHPTLMETHKRLQTLQNHIFPSLEKAITVAGLKPSISEIIQLMETGKAGYNEIQSGLQHRDSEKYATIRDLIDSLPPGMKHNIATMAKRAQYKAKTTEEGIRVLRQEIENSFDSSMQRAGGVYKRNAKGVAILIGIVIAFGANADTFYIIDRLSKDTALREAIVYKAQQTIDQQVLDPNLKSIDTNQILEDISLPIGWSEKNLAEQLGTNPIKINGVSVVSSNMIMGWLVSGFAIAMGAPFWFDLLGKVMNVRNTGKGNKGTGN